MNGLYTKITKSGPVGPLLTHNPNEYNPQRLTHSEALTSDQNHGYTPEQQAENNGKMDMFVQQTEYATPANGCAALEYCPPGIVMDYFDGNTVTGAVELRAVLLDERQQLGHRPSARQPRARST